MIAVHAELSSRPTFSPNNCTTGPTPTPSSTPIAPATPIPNPAPTAIATASVTNISDYTIAPTAATAPAIIAPKVDYKYLYVVLLLGYLKM